MDGWIDEWIDSYGIVAVVVNLMCFIYQYFGLSIH